MQFRFLHPAKLTDYDEVLTLFFEVLNRAPADRSPDVVAAFPEVPYLNSSLFEPSTLEGHTFDISGLRDGLGLAPYPGSVLRKAGTPSLPPAKASTSAAPQWAALPYLLHFLDAYDFATNPTTTHAPAETAEAPWPAEAARPLLLAAGLGLVFEKINGYKDDSSDEQAAIAALVTGILAAKAADPAADTQAAEAAVDAAVAALYEVALLGAA